MWPEFINSLRPSVIVEGVELRTRRNGSPIPDRHPTDEELHEIWAKLERGDGLTRLEFLRFQSLCAWTGIMRSAAEVKL